MDRNPIVFFSGVVVSPYVSGDRIADFEVEERLGSGGFGTVYRCRWLLDGNSYAVKIVEGTVEAVRREFEALRSVDHPGVVKCHHAASLPEGGWYLQFELVDGETLDRFTSPGSVLPVDRALEIGCQLLEALEAIHPNTLRIDELKSRTQMADDEFDELRSLEAAGLVHRDIKPSNLMLRGSGKLVLVDFGIASKAGQAVLTKKRTHGYMPPDMTFHPGERWTPDVDLFAAGVVIFELVCGFHPYDEVSLGQGPLPAASHVLPSLARWLAKACASSREQRYRTATEMLADLRDVREEVANQADDQSEVFELKPYSAWQPVPIGGTADHDLLGMFLVVVAYEGPVLCSRVYRAIAEELGVPFGAIKSRLNRIAYHAVWRGDVEQVEPSGGGQMDKTVYRKGQSGEPRELGPRRVEEYPLVELKALVDLVFGPVEDVEGEFEDAYLSVAWALDVDPATQQGLALMYSLRRLVDLARRS
jgi:serine/threonine protein kinase